MKTQYNPIFENNCVLAERHRVVSFNIWLHSKLIKSKTSLYVVSVFLFRDWEMCNEVDMQLVLFTRKKRDKCVCGPPM